MEGRLDKEYGVSCSVVGLDGRLWLRLSAGIYNTKEEYKKVAVAVQRLQNREIAKLEGVITGDGPLSCVVYRSESKGVYLYVENDDSLLTPGDKLASLLDLIEPLVSTGVTVDLVEDRKLGQGGTAHELRRRLKGSEFYMCRARQGVDIRDNDVHLDAEA